MLSNVVRCFQGFILLQLAQSLFLNLFSPFTNGKLQKTCQKIMSKILACCISVKVILEELFIEKLLTARQVTVEEQGTTQPQQFVCRSRDSYVGCNACRRFKSEAEKFRKQKYRNVPSFSRRISVMTARTWRWCGRITSI